MTFKYNQEYFQLLEDGFYRGLINTLSILLIQNKIKVIFVFKNKKKEIRSRLLRKRMKKQSVTKKRL